METYYKPSGRFSPLAFVYLGVASFIVFPIVGIIYSYAIWYIPFIYLNFLLTIGLGFVMGFIISGLVINLGKVRNLTLGYGLAFLGTSIGYYFHWAVWATVAISSSMEESIGLIESFQLALDPVMLGSLLNEINEVGAWGFGDSAVSGTMLTIVWVIEALIIMIVATFISGANADDPFCEESNKWFKSVILVRSYISDASSLVKNLEAGNQDAFDQIAVGDSQNHHGEFTLYSSEKGENYVTISNKIASTNDKGELEFDTENVVTNIAISEHLSKLLISPNPVEPNENNEATESDAS